MPMGEWRCAVLPRCYRMQPNSVALVGRCRRERSRKSRPYVRLLRFGVDSGAQGGIRQGYREISQLGTQPHANAHGIEGQSRKTG
jgi:hypothetical protein